MRRLEAAGAVLVGALNMDEYAYGFTTENTHYGPTRNPHDLARISGGSSGGSAAAVAAGQVPLTLGSDTNGSIRVPASLCGTFGLKPTFGRLPRTGSYPFVASLDHLGPFARSARATWRWPTTRCRAPTRDDPACAQRARRAGDRRRCGAAPTACASACSAAGSARWRWPEALAAVDARGAGAGRHARWSSCPRWHAPAPRPSSITNAEGARAAPGRPADPRAGLRARCRATASWPAR